MYPVEECAGNRSLFSPGPTRSSVASAMQLHAFRIFFNINVRLGPFLTLTLSSAPSLQSEVPSQVLDLWNRGFEIGWQIKLVIRLNELNPTWGYNWAWFQVDRRRNEIGCLCSLGTQLKPRQNHHCSQFCLKWRSCNIKLYQISKYIYTELIFLIMNRLTIAEKLGSEELDGAKAAVTIFLFITSISTVVLSIAK